MLNYLWIDNDEKTASSWRESSISKSKRERQNYNHEKVAEMKLRYSREKSGIKIKQHPSTQISERNHSQKILMDVNVLRGIDLDHIAKDNIDSFVNKICTENKFLADTSSTRCIKTLCGLLNDSWKHYIYFHPEKLASPQPSILIDDENIKVYVDWSYVCSCTSIDQNIAVLVGLYFLLGLKLHPHRTTIRFLYVYLMADKNQQSHVIRRFCKEYNQTIQWWTMAR
ncbi:unnamed protein product [Rotaria socialis]|nr:unnamed protein product [Rotaria socialis]